MDSITSSTQSQLSDKHKMQRDSARDERDSALHERDLARTERDDFEDRALDQNKNSIAQELFVATLSHDLRNPIAAIKMAVEIIKDNADEKLRMEMTALIDRNADQAGDLISQLLDANLVKSGAKLQIEPKKCELVSILKKCKAALAPQDQDRLSIITDINFQVWGNWDPRALERAFKNIISNSLKFSDKGKQVLIKLWQGPDITNISFQNFGKIISLENQLKIFDSHFRVQDSGKDVQMGWGLGLTLVKGICESHGGKVDVASSQTEGTVFTIRLPN